MDKSVSAVDVGSIVTNIIEEIKINEYGPAQI
jgi:hypothetical protein